jgi:hypothetical protein
MMIEILQLRIVDAADVNNTSRDVGQILIAWLPPLNWCTMQMGEQTTGQEIVFMGSAWVGHDELDCHGSLNARGNKSTSLNSELARETTQEDNPKTSYWHSLKLRQVTEPNRIHAKAKANPHLDSSNCSQSLRKL